MTKARTDAALRLKNKINTLYGWLRKYNKRYAYSEEMYSYTELNGLCPWTWRDEPCPHQRSYNRAKHRNHHKEQVSRTSPTPCNERRLYQRDKEINEIKQFHGYLLIFFDDLYKKHYMLSKLCDESSKDLSTHPIKYSYMPILNGENIIAVEIGCEISTISKFLTTQYYEKPQALQKSSGYFEKPTRMFIANLLGFNRTHIGHHNTPDQLIYHIL